MALPDILRISPHKTPGWNIGEPHVIILHGTRGGAAYGTEFLATLNWFDNPASQVSAHWVIARDGTTARVVPDSHKAWHAAEHNGVSISIELEQPSASDRITIPQYEKLALIGKTFYPSITARHLTTVGTKVGWIEHMETPQGIRVGKSDVGTFNWQTFLSMLRQEDDMNEADWERMSGLLRGAVLAIGTGQMNSGMRNGDPDWTPPMDLKDVMDKLAAVERTVNELKDGDGTTPKTVKFPGATIKVPPVDMPVE